MKVIFYLKGATRIDWLVPDPSTFNFSLMVKMIRADGQFLAEGLYIQASEVAAILLDHSKPVAIRDVDDDGPNVRIRHKNKVEQLKLDG